MVDFITLWLRGLVFGIAFFSLIGLVYGFVMFTVAFPYVGLPALFLIILPIMFGILTEGKL